MIVQKTIHKYEVLARYIEDKNYGETVSRQEIEEITGQTYKSQRFYAVVAKTKKLLEAEGKMIVPAGGGDYKVAYPGDYAIAYCREVRLAGKRISRGGKILDCAPTKDMTQSELQTHNRLRDFHVGLYAHLRGAVVEVRKLSDRKHPLEAGIKNKGGTT